MIYISDKAITCNAGAVVTTISTLNVINLISEGGDETEENRSYFPATLREGVATIVEDDAVIDNIGCLLSNAASNNETWLTFSLTKTTPVSFAAGDIVIALINPLPIAMMKDTYDTQIEYLNQTWLMVQF
jgi:hypothetical protein